MNQSSVSSANQGLVIGYILAALGAFLYSTKAILAKLVYAVGPIEVETLLALRMLLALPFFLVIGTRILIKYPERRHALTSKQILQASAVGILGYYGASWFDFAGLKYLSAQMERLILFTYPIFVVLFGALFFGAKLNRWTIPAFLLSYCGIAVMFVFGVHEQPQALWKGSALILAAAITFAFYQLFAKQIITQVGSRLYTSIAMSAASAACLVHFFMVHDWIDLLIDSEQLLYIGLIAFFSTVIPSYMMNEALNRIGPNAVGMMGNLGPIFTAGLAVIILGEAFGWPEAFGTAIVLVAILLFSKSQRA